MNAKTERRQTPRAGARSAARPAARTADRFPHLAIENVRPEIDAGRFPAKRTVGSRVVVSADVLKDGHDLTRARIRYQSPGSDAWRYAPMTFSFEDDRWSGSFVADEVGRWRYTVDAWTDSWGTWRSKLEKKSAAGQDVDVDLMEGAELVRGAARKLRYGDARRRLEAMADAMDGNGTDFPPRIEAALSPGLSALMEEHAPQYDLISWRELELVVDPEKAAFAAWYEFFPRSAGAPGQHGTFADAERMLPRIAELGFDVVYLPPIHPIGRTFRKGKNNTLTPEPDDVGSPWAIGNEHGGHEAIEPALGTVDDFVRFVKRANELGLEIALDFALQCSPDHPWVKEHPDWFVIRPDGTIQYAENPPKKYQDIYPINFWTDDREALWNACRDVLLLWIERGVRTFRVDNPHTKPFAFWEWCIAEVKQRHPDIVFLSEAFTRPKRLLHLAKLGFSQSYTYFTWKNTSAELREWLDEFGDPEIFDYYRGNYFANTPDILHEYLQHGGPAAFRVRLLLAATMSPLYGLYSGYELYEGTAVKPGSEEYHDSEKYQIRHREYGQPGSLDDEIRRINRIRREQPPLQRFDNITVHPTENAGLFFFRKADPHRIADLLVVANVDPHGVQAGIVHVPIAELGMQEHDSYEVEDLLTGARYTWRGSRNFVMLDPARQPGHVFRVERRGAARAAAPPAAPLVMPHATPHGTAHHDPAFQPPVSAGGEGA